MATLTGGEKLQAYLATVASNLASAGSGPEVRVGFLEGSTYPDGTSIPTVAAYNEFGTQRSPPRPFFRRMIKQDAPSWGPAMTIILKNNKMNAAKSLGQMGMLIKGQLQQSIHDLTSPPLAASTIRRKGFDKPLIDTGDMWKSVDYQISGTRGSFGGITWAHGGSLGTVGS
jgi:hypothetical protein